MFIARQRHVFLEMLTDTMKLHWSGCSADGSRHVFTTGRTVNALMHRACS